VILGIIGIPHSFLEEWDERLIAHADQTGFGAPSLPMSPAVVKNDVDQFHVRLVFFLLWRSSTPLDLFDGTSSRTTIPNAGILGRHLVERLQRMKRANSSKRIGCPESNPFVPIRQCAL
jgi:hypothetical protein